MQWINWKWLVFELVNYERSSPLRCKCAVCVWKLQDTFDWCRCHVQIQIQSIYMGITIQWHVHLIIWSFDQRLSVLITCHSYTIMIYCINLNYHIRIACSARIKRTNKEENRPSFFFHSIECSAIHQCSSEGGGTNHIWMRYEPEMSFWT